MSVSIKAGILSYVLTILVLISVGLSMLTLYVYYSKLELANYTIKNRLKTNLNTAIEISLGSHSKFPYSETHTVDLYGDGIDTITFMKQRWGLFDVYTTSSKSGKRSISKFYSIGHLPEVAGRSAIYLQDDGRPVTLSGKTKIIGNAYFPQSRALTGYVGRIGYLNDTLVYGNIRQSEAKLPSVNIEKHFNEIDVIDGVNTTNRSDTVYSFSNTEPLVIEGHNLQINSQNLTGKILLKSDSCITFFSAAHTGDIIAKAPKIVLKKGFRGNGQFYATDTLIVEKNTHLKYPSILGVYNDDRNALIKIQEDSKVEGYLIMSGNKEGLRQRVLSIEEDVKVTGFVYCDGLLETYGTIHGHVATKRFLVNAPTAVYENYIFNTTLDITQLPKDYLMIDQWFNSDTVKVLKYLY